MKRWQAAIGIVGLCLLTGCGAWLRVGGPYTSPAHGISVEFPDGWMRMNDKDVILITRDGVLLQYIIIQTLNVSDPLKFTKKTFRRGMLPQEVAEVILDNKASNPGTLNFKITENTPAKIGGHPGFKATYTYKNKDGLRLKGLYYGALVGETFYGISYNAATRHYYQFDLATFDKVVRTFRINAA